MASGKPTTRDPASPAKPRRVFIDSANWSCRPNLMTTARLMRYLRRQDHLVVRRPEEADMIVINSCGFIQDLEDRSRALYRSYAAAHPKATVVFAGCLSRLGDVPEGIDGPVLADIEQIGPLLGENNGFEGIGVFLDDVVFSDICASDVDMRYAPANPRLLDFALRRLVPCFERSRRNRRLLRVMKTEGFFQAADQENAAVEISRGCVFNCHYCIIKKARGGLRSRPPRDVLADVDHLARSTGEVRLVADDCGSYGQDIGTSLLELINEIHSCHPQLALSINYLNPTWLERDHSGYVEAFKRVSIPSVNVSMQTCSQSLLSAMNRHYSASGALEAVDRIRSVSPDTIVFSHFIVGHPGESWRDFALTLRRTGCFDFISIFRYSPRQDTVSASMADQVSDRTTAARYHLLLNAMRLRILLRLLRHQWF